MEYYDEIAAAAQAIRKRSSSAPKIGVVLGSGLGAFADRLEHSERVAYSEIPHFPKSTVAGHAGTLVMGAVQGVPCVVLSGRVHFYEGHAMLKVTFPMRVLALLGVKTVIVTNAAGGINPSFQVGDLMLIRDHLNLTGDNPLRGANDERLGPRFPDMSEAYGTRERQSMQRCAQELGLGRLHEGVYAGLAGPSYETPAEIRMLQTLGADAVGMSTVAEVIVARHSGVNVVGISVITNQGAGLGHTQLSHDEVKDVGKKVEKKLCDLFFSAIPRLL